MAVIVVDDERYVKYNFQYDCFYIIYLQGGNRLSKIRDEEEEDS
jgi:hypothetical protein